jgi:arylsulfatase A-like enzyme
MMTIQDTSARRRHRATVDRPSTLALALGTFAVLAATSCSAPPADEATRWRAVQVATEDPVVAQIEAEGQMHKHWQEWDGDSVPVITVTDQAVVRVAVGDLGGARVAGGYVLGANRHDQNLREAGFRITAATGDGTRRVLFEDRLLPDGGLEAHRLEEVRVPSDLTGPGEIAFEMSMPSGPGVAWARWLDPEVRLPVAPAEEPAGGPAETPPYNVLIITSDTTRQDALGTYGGPAATPALDALAADGVRLDQMYSLGYGTLPSHSSLFTGAHPREHGVYDNETILSDDSTTLAEVLLGAGYHTAAFVGAKPVARRLGLDQGFLRYDDVFLHDPGSALEGYWSYERRARRTTDRFLQWQASANGPFAAWVHFFDPHQPYMPIEGIPQGEPEAVTRIFEQEGRAPRYVHLTEKRPGVVTDLGDVPLEEVDRAAQRRYREEVEAMDAQLGRLLGTLRKRGAYRDTLIVFVSDHGENFLDRGRLMAFDHAGLFAEVTRLASVVKLPGSEHAGRTTNILAANADLACLAVDVAGLTAPESWSCRSFLRHLGDDGAERRFRPHIVLEGSSHHELAVRTPAWVYRVALPSMPEGMKLRLGYSLDSTTLLFDLDDDPQERDNVAAAPQNRNEVERLRGIARDFLARGEAQQGRKLEDEKHLEALRALGYLD